MNEEAKRAVLPYLKIETKHVPLQTERFTEMLAAFVASAGDDETGLALFNLHDAAKYMRQSYERIERMLARIDNQEATPQHESGPVTPETLRKLNDLYYNRQGDMGDMEAYYSALEEARACCLPSGLTIILAENHDPDYTLYMTHALVPAPQPGAKSSQQVPSDDALIDAAKSAFLDYLAGDPDRTNQILDVKITAREKTSVDIRIEWTFDGAIPPAPDDALYTVSFENGEITDVFGPEW